MKINVPRKISANFAQRIMRTIDPILGSSKLVKRNVWIDNYPFEVREGMMVSNVDWRYVEIVPYEETSKPAIYRDQVFQICVIDWDNDCVLKDDFNGVQIIHDVVTGDEEYDTRMIEEFPEHPLRNLYQLKYHSTILSGKTLDLQLILDLQYRKKRYI